MKLNKRTIIYIMLLVVLVASAIYLITKDDTDSSYSQPLSTPLPQSTSEPMLESNDNYEVKQKFNCDRTTDDVRETDIFCSYPELYYSDLSTMQIREIYYCDAEIGRYPICDSPNELEARRNELNNKANKYR